MTKFMLVISSSDKSLMDHSEATLEMNGVKAYITEENDHGVLYHLRVEGKRNYNKACALLGITPANNSVKVEITAEAHDTISAYFAQWVKAGNDPNLSEFLICCVKQACS